MDKIEINYPLYKDLSLLLFHSLSNNNLREISLSNCKLLDYLISGDASSNLENGRKPSLERRRATIGHGDLLARSSAMMLASLNITKDEASIELGLFLERNTDLLKIDLSFNHLGMFSLHSMAAISTLGKLHYLDISGNDLNVETCGIQVGMWMKAILTECHVLDTFIADDNRISERELLDIAQGLRTREGGTPMTLISVRGSEMFSERSVRKFDFARKKSMLKNLRLDRHMQHWFPFERTFC